MPVESAVGLHTYTQLPSPAMDTVSIHQIVATMASCTSIKEERELYKALGKAAKVQFGDGSGNRVYLLLNDGGVLVLNK